MMGSGEHCIVSRFSQNQNGAILFIYFLLFTFFWEGIFVNSEANSLHNTKGLKQTSLSIPFLFSNKIGNARYCVFYVFSSNSAGGHLFLVFCFLIHLTSPTDFPVNIAQWGPYVFLPGQADLPISGLWSFLSWATSGSPDGPAQIQSAQLKPRFISLQHKL